MQVGQRIEGAEVIPYTTFLQERKTLIYPKALGGGEEGRQVLA
jgi:hypothetical protein